MVEDHWRVINNLRDQQLARDYCCAVKFCPLAELVFGVVSCDCVTLHDASAHVNVAVKSRHARTYSETVTTTTKVMTIIFVVAATAPSVPAHAMIAADFQMVWLV